MIVKNNSDENIIIYFHKIFYPGDIHNIDASDFFTLNDPNILYRYFSVLPVEDEYLFLFNNTEIESTFDNLHVRFEKQTDCLLNGEERIVDSIYLLKKDIIIYSQEESFKVEKV